MQYAFLALFIINTILGVAFLKKVFVIDDKINALSRIKSSYGLNFSREEANKLLSVLCNIKDEQLEHISNTTTNTETSLKESIDWWIQDLEDQLDENL